MFKKTKKRGGFNRSFSNKSTKKRGHSRSAGSNDNPRNRGKKRYSDDKSDGRRSRPQGDRRGGGDRRGSYRGGGRRSGGDRRGGGRRRGGGNKVRFNPEQFIKKDVSEPSVEVYKPKNSFSSFDIDDSLKKNIKKLNLVTLTPIQDKIIPEILLGKDVIGVAETGTGKTAAILIPMIDKVLKDKKQRTIILTPTRELAVQIDKDLKSLAKGLGINSVVCVGGLNINPQIKSLKKRNNEFVIGTPGRVLDLMKRRCIDSEGMTNLVFDEADRMLDIGFIKEMRTIVSKLKKERQTLFFSATMTDPVKKIANEFLIDEICVSVKKKDISASIEQDVVFYTRNDKTEKLLELLNKKGFERVIIFGAMKHSVEALSKHLRKNKIKAESIHGNKSSGQRQRTLDRFRKGELNALVATDVVSRGIHVDDVQYVINYDLPDTFEDYVHRIGRTGRAHKKGKALTFLLKE